MSADQVPGFSQIISPKRRRRTHRRIDVAIEEGPVDGFKDCAGAVSIRFRRGEFETLKGAEVLVVPGGSPGDPWSIASGNVQDGESARDAALRVVRDKGGMPFHAEYVDIGFLLQKNNTGGISARTFSMPSQGHLSSIERHEMTWVPLSDVLEDAQHHSSHATSAALAGVCKEMHHKLSAGDMQRGSRRAASTRRNMPPVEEAPGRIFAGRATAGLRILSRALGVPLFALLHCFGCAR